MQDPTAELQAALNQETRTEQAKALGEVLSRIPQFATHVRKLREQVVHDMHALDDMSWAEIGEAIGQHRTRAAQIGKGVVGGSKKRRPGQQEAPPAE
jgi:hypothetical protein